MADRESLTIRPRWRCVIDAVAASVRLHRWGLGFRQCSFRHITRVLQDGTFSVFQCPPLFRHAPFPSGFSPSGQSDDPGATLRAPPDWVRDSTPRSAAHDFQVSGSPVIRFPKFSLLACRLPCSLPPDQPVPLRHVSGFPGPRLLRGLRRRRARAP